MLHLMPAVNTAVFIRETPIPGTEVWTTETAHHTFIATLNHLWVAVTRQEKFC